ncbi:hypothetical protein GCM10010399_94610 [Dactylosporangium fulvum]|uniref:Secreted protein n=1 Tax=Dactylosporangium fulvum TaxID=53359 RepID=A0ABY5VP94_9ACTN|nr:hypothetical protein [Dactylosporangium fulvum]UWP79508.1 hypothetical protein Dfulv_30615 [Dactylosporangium fulvum]
MDAATTSAVVLPLVGVVLGTAGTLVGQFLATRGERRRHTADLAAAARAERKQAVVDFLSAAQRVERVIDNAQHRSHSADRDTVDELLHSLWLSKKLLELVCGHDVASTAHRFTSTLENMARGGADLTDRQRANRAEFMESARCELGIDGPRLYPVGAGRRGVEGPE